MGRLDETRFIERQQFFNGQRLFASDLQGLEAFHREMRWLHNQSLHQPGVGRGLAVSGREGDRQLSIGPGYAIDAWGREIVLTQDWVEPVPPVAGENDGTPVFYDLTVSYPDDAYLEEAEMRAGVCLPRGVVRLREEPVFCWVRLKRDDRGNLRATNQKLGNDIKNGLKIVVARAEVLNCQLNSDILIAQRRSARPSGQPYVACGETYPPPWTTWSLLEPEEENLPRIVFEALKPVVLPLGLRAHIDTSTGRFRTTPHYSARIAGSRVKSLGDLTLLIDALLNIRDPRPDGFTLEVLLFVEKLSPDPSPEEPQPPPAPGGPGLVRALLRPAPAAAIDEAEEVDLWPIADWSVVWMGVEG